jgi:peptidoglycan hydrolase FlgJ
MSIGSISSRADHQLAAQARLVNQYLSGDVGNALSGVPGASGVAERHGSRSLQPSGDQAAASSPASANSEQAPSSASSGASNDVREKFDAFVGQSFYGQLLHEMHKTVGKSHYFNGGRAEEAFQGQLDQVLSEKMAKANASSFTGPMFELFNAQMQAANRR